MIPESIRDRFERADDSTNSKDIRCERPVSRSCDDITDGLAPDRLCSRVDDFRLRLRGFHWWRVVQYALGRSLRLWEDVGDCHHLSSGCVRHPGICTAVSSVRYCVR
ncbi:unnamed protein product, partial [Mycena citricolor]